MFTPDLYEIKYYFIARKITKVRQVSEYVEKWKVSNINSKIYLKSSLKMSKTLQDIHTQECHL